MSGPEFIPQHRVQMATNSPNAAHQPRVSALIIFYNAAPFLEEAIRSVLCQSYADWELLLMDDGSTDGSSDLARNYADQFPHAIRYLEHPGHANRGKSVSRNRGVAEARGEWIAFLDADDVWLPHKLRDQVRLMELHPEAVMLYGPVEYWANWAEHGHDGSQQKLSKLGVTPNALIQPPHLFCSFLRQERKRNETICPYPSSVLVRREIFLQLGGFEEEFRQLYDDVVFFTKVFLAAPVYVAETCWVKYRMPAKQLFSQSYAQAIKTGDWDPRKPNPAEQEFLTWLESYLAERGITDWQVKRALAESWLPYRHPRWHRYLIGAEHSFKTMKNMIKSAAKKVTPKTARTTLRAWWRGPEAAPEPGGVRFGSLRRLTPISRFFGYDRGTPVDRYYIEKFLETHAGDIRGRVLEIGDNFYTRRFGGERVTQSDVLHRLSGNPLATFVGDLNEADLPDNAFDCVIFTQTLLCIYDVKKAAETLHRILKPGGAVLATLPGICQIAQPDMELWGDFWRFTTLSAQRLFSEFFPSSNVQVQSHGNVLVATAFLHGLAQQELTAKELDHWDPDYQVNITVRAVKPEGNG